MQQVTKDTTGFDVTTLKVGAHMRNTVIVLVSLAAIFGPAPAAWGQGVGGNSPTHTTHSLEVVFVVPEEYHSRLGEVGTQVSPLGVQLDPNGPVWEKVFQVDTSVIPSISPQAVSRISEHLIVEGDLPWTGWSIDIATQDFAWFPRPSGGRFWFSMLTPYGFTFVPGMQATFEQSRLDFTFDPLPVGTQISIIADIRYEGAQPFASDLQLNQYPVPEPASALVLMSLLALRPFRRI